MHRKAAHPIEKDKGADCMHREWIRSPVFWLSIVSPALVTAAAGAARYDLVAPDRDQWLLLCMAGLGIGAVVGIFLAARCGFPPRLLGGDEEAHGESSLSAEQAETYRDLFENAADIVFTTDLSGHFLAGNKAVRRQLGYTVEEAKSLTWEKLVPAYDMWKAEQMFKRHARGEKQISFELDIIAASGRIKTFEIGSRAMFDRGRLCGFHGIARDITSRKEMEKQLETARREAESANESKSTFLANMSHEIRTPINGILGFLSLFAKTGLNTQQKEYLVPIEESAKHLLKIINDILDLSKIEAGHFSIENEIVSFRDVVKSAVDLLRPMGESKGLEVSLYFDPEIPSYVVGDGTRIGQIVYNLVNNAIKFTDAGSVAVESRVGEKASTYCSIEVRVTDTGIGIANEDQAALFEPFHQLDSQPDRKYAGTGLGLTISRNLVEAMGGSIRVRSEPGRYTAIELALPLGTAPVQVDAPSRDGQDMSHRFDGRGLAALIVDDNEINRWYLSAVLAQYGMAVESAPSGGQALEACRARDFDIVFMDIHMADMDGIETTRRLRAQLPRYRSIPVVAVSADVMGNKGARFTDQGLDHFLAKPVKEDSLVLSLSKIFPARAGESTDGRPRRTLSSDESGGTAQDAPVLDPVEGIALASHDEALWRRSVRALRRQAKDSLPRMQSALSEGRHEDMRQTAHKLAGAAGYVAARELAAHARALEQACREQSHQAAGRRLAALERAVEQLLDAEFDPGR
jgi:PAS domain S-box-containing protein